VGSLPFSTLVVRLSPFDLPSIQGQIGTIQVSGQAGMDRENDLIRLLFHPPDVPHHPVFIQQESGAGEMEIFQRMLKIGHKGTFSGE
jgi:hypothetical protein